MKLIPLIALFSVLAFSATSFADTVTVEKLDATSVKIRHHFKGRWTDNDFEDYQFAVRDLTPPRGQFVFMLEPANNVEGKDVMDLSEVRKIESELIQRAKIDLAHSGWVHIPVKIAPDIEVQLEIDYTVAPIWTARSAPPKDPILQWSMKFYGVSISPK